MAGLDGLTTPLDQWVCASARTARLDMLLRSCGPTSRADYSQLNIDDALPLLSHACKTAFGDLTALDFDIKSSQGPLVYSAVLTITGPDEIGIEFPDSGKHVSRLQAKMHAAHKAIIGGAIGYIMQSARPGTPELNEPSIHVPTSPQHAPDRVPQIAPPNEARDVVPSVKQGKKSRGTKPKAPPDALNLINTYLQRVYRDHKTSMPRSSQEWAVVFGGGEVTARLTIRLPSGKSKTYGGPSGNHSELGRYSRATSASAAKRNVANQALQAGVLDFIESDTPNGTTLSQPPSPTAIKVRAHDPLSSYVAYDPSKAARTTTGANSVPVSGIASTSAHGLPPRPSISEPEPEENVPAPSVGPVPPLEQVIEPNIPSRNTSPHPSRSPSPVDEMEAVDELLGPASLSNLESSEREEEEEEEEVDQLASSECGDDGVMSEGRSESMELDSETGTPPKEITVTHTEKRVSPLEDKTEPIDESPNKRRRTEPPESPIQEANQEPEPQEPKVMLGTTYSSILSEFCFEHGHAQPQVTYQRNFGRPKAEGPVMYSVSITLSTSRFELSKPYESIELAEEKLSKRILRQFGVRAKILSI